MLLQDGGTKITATGSTQVTQSVSMKVSLVTSKGKVLWANPNYSYREQYQVSRDAPSFTEEEEPALGRIASSFAKSLVSDILEAY